MSTSPTQLSLKNIRGRGYLAAIVERWNPHAKIRQDLFGIIDVIGVCSLGTIAVQSTTYSNMSTRIKKIEESETLSQIIDANWLIEVHGWRKVKNKWEARIIEITY